ncbi:MAG: Radical SAM protein [uncultured bacterium]|nr:MAG: Radical SAM protein [uncultured bacterium]HBR79152.1 radical SAM protein [Candidatus Moranbacteria bacterium]
MINRMQIKEIKAKSIITKSNLPDADFVINPYVGCMHACIYCYANFMKRFTGHIEPWGKFIDVKINAPDLIPENSLKYKGKSIFLSSVTDPYLSLERKYELTRKILKKLIPLEPNLGIQTKSDLIVRDIDLLKQFKNCEAGLTITTTDDNIRKEVEPYTASISNRIKALKEMKEAGIKTYVFIGPIFPYLTDWKDIINNTKTYADFYMLENLNVKGSVWNNIKLWLELKHPELIEKYEEIYFTKNNYWNDMEKEITKYCNDNNIDCRIYFHHGK